MFLSHQLNGYDLSQKESEYWKNDRQVREAEIMREKTMARANMTEEQLARETAVEIQQAEAEELADEEISQGNVLTL